MFPLLANFFRSPVEFEGMISPTVAHAFQAARTRKHAEQARKSQLPTLKKRSALNAV
jgi:hypothetical protein